MIMPHISRQEALRLIAKTRLFFKNARLTGKLKICQIKSGGHIDAEDLKTFLLTVDIWRVLCFDTEGGGKLLYKVGPNKGKKGPVVFGNPAGMVLIFHDSCQVPPELVLHHVDLLCGRMPFLNELKFLDLRFHPMDHCSHCRLLEHCLEVCSELTTLCCYDHGPDFNLLAHSIVCCPALHAYCQECFIRGHFSESHDRGWKSAAQLCHQFLESAPQGLYTSLLYLIRTDLMVAKIKQHHFQLGISGRRLIEAYGDYWLYRGFGPIPEAKKNKGERYQKAAMQNIDTDVERTFVLCGGGHE
jgi:hypothetical protein